MGLHCRLGFFSSCGVRGPLSSEGTGSSLRRLRRGAGSRAHRLGSWCMRACAAAPGPGAQAQASCVLLLHGRWDRPSGSSPVFCIGRQILHQQPPGKPSSGLLNSPWSLVMYKFICCLFCRHPHPHPGRVNYQGTGFFSPVF